MKRIIIAVSLALAAVSASVQAMPTEADQRVCKNWSNVAKGVMMFRQYGADIDKAIEFVKKQHESYHKFGFELVLMAYEAPELDAHRGSVVYGNFTSNQQRMVDEFKNDTQVDCLKIRTRSKK
jgi:hypothetical protein